MSTVVSSPANALRGIRTPAYLILTTAMVLPLFDYANGLLPLNPGDAIWRFGAVSLVASYAVATTAQILFLLALAAILGDRKVLMTLAAVSGVVAFALLCMAGLYGLDSLEARARTSDATRRRLEMTAVLVMVKLLVLSVANALVVRFAWREARRARSGYDSGAGQILVPRKSGTVAARS